MPNPLVLYTTSLPLPTRQRSQQEYLIRILTTLRIPFDACDVSLDELGKRIWRRKGRTNGALPGYLVRGEYVGDLDEFEYAVEDGRLKDFLGLNTPEATASTGGQAGSLKGAAASQGGEKGADSLASKEVSPDELLLKDVTEDELEKLLREMEAEGV